MCVVHRDVYLYVEPCTYSEVCIHGCVRVDVCHCACGSERGRHRYVYMWVSGGVWK